MSHEFFTGFEMIAHEYQYKRMLMDKADSLEAQGKEIAAMLATLSALQVETNIKLTKILNTIIELQER